MTTDGQGRHGRLPAHLRPARRAEIIAAARAELVDHGYEKTTMDRVAKRAQASKSTLYSWFGDKEGLAAAVITAGSDEVVATIAGATDTDTAPDDLEAVVDSLAAVSTAMLVLLTDPATIAYDQAAITRPELVEVIYGAGRNRAGRIIIDYLRLLDSRGALPIPDPDEAFRVLFGLTVQDMQSAAMLGRATPSAEQCRAHGRTVAEDFVHIMRGRAAAARD